MAKQNFLAGGYYGKLGATVGQRWKNIRTIRTYVIPQNPRTPEQQANRNVFGRAVPFAQLGMQLNKASPAWDISGNTEWAQRMSVARNLVNAGNSDVACIPIVPADFSTQYTITAVTLDSIQENTAVKFLLTASLPSGAKDYGFMLYFADGARQGEYLLLAGQSDASDNTLVTCPCEDTSGIQNSTIYLVAASRNDTDATTVTYSNRLQLQNTTKPAFAQTYAIETVQGKTDGTIQITLQMGIYGNDLVGTFEEDGILIYAQAKYKSDCFNAGSESGATYGTLSPDGWTITDFSYSTVTGNITIKARHSNYKAIQLYNISNVTVAVAWSNAYNDNTSMSSGTASASKSSIGILRTQSEVNTSVDTIEVTPLEEVEDGIVSYNADITFQDPSVMQLITKLYGASLPATFIAQPDAQGNFVVEDRDGSGSTLTENGDFYLDNVDNDGQTLSLQMSTEIDNWTSYSMLYLISLIFSNRYLSLTKGASTTRQGVYDDDHIWTAFPSFRLNGTFQP